MESVQKDQSGAGPGCHVVAMPYPGRGHINPMLNFCNLIASTNHHILVTFVVTEEWFDFLNSEAKPPNVRFSTIPNVIPSEIGRGVDFPGFFEATLTKLEEPFERLLDRLDPSTPSVIIYDTFLMWAVDVGNRRNIPVASFWSMQASVFTVFHHFDLLVKNDHFPANVSEVPKSPDVQVQDAGGFQVIGGDFAVKVGFQPLFVDGGLQRDQGGDWSCSGFTCTRLNDASSGEIRSAEESKEGFQLRPIPLDLHHLQLGNRFQEVAATDSNSGNKGIRIIVESKSPERGKEVVDYIPGIPSICIADLPTIYYGDVLKTLHRVLEAIARVPRAQYLLFTSIYELEVHVIDSLKAIFPIPIYSIGPAIPYLRLGHDSSLFKDEINGINYLQWLDSQPKASVLYISQGSFLSVSRAQMDEIIAGVIKSGVRFLWVARGEVFRIKKECGENGVVVPWCNQLKVLCHPSIGGFWSHCGWNSTKEGVFAGIPFLTYPIFWDQVTNSKTIIEDWKIGWKVRQGMGEKEQLVTLEEIGELVHRFMNLESEEGKQMRIRAKELQEICHRATSEGGSAKIDIDAFIMGIS
ncbi:7-deoxyloganetin glucosyltransferase [Sarracenia purpurea var. burkii]